MKKVLFFIVVCLCGFGLSAAELTGIFGKKFGTVVAGDVKNTEYSFSPDEKFSGFADFKYQVTPLSRKIYSISTVRQFDDLSAAKKEYEKIFKYLTGHYDVKGEFQNQDDSMTFWFNFDNGCISVSLNRYSGGGFYIMVMAMDDKLLALRSREVEKAKKP